MTRRIEVKQLLMHIPLFWAELKLRMSEERSCPLKAPPKNLPQESSKETVKQNMAGTPPSPSVEKTIDAVMKRMKEKREQLSIPENIKVPGFRAVFMFTGQDLVTVCRY